MPYSLADRRRIAAQHDKAAQTSVVPAIRVREEAIAERSLSDLLTEVGVEHTFHFFKRWIIHRYINGRISLNEIAQLGNEVSRLADQIEREDI